MACVVPGCSHRMGRFYVNNGNISFHRFPADTELKKTWIKNVKREDGWTPSQYSRICSAHFEECCFRIGYNRKTLHSHAVPTIFINHPLSCQPKLPKTRKLIAKYDSINSLPSTATTDKKVKLPKMRKHIVKYDSINSLPSTSTATTDKKVKLPNIRVHIAECDSINSSPSTSTATTDKDVKLPNIQVHIAEDDSIDSLPSTSTATTDKEVIKGTPMKENRTCKTEIKSESYSLEEITKTKKLLEKYKILAAKRGKKIKTLQRKCLRLVKKNSDLGIIIESLQEKMENEPTSKTTLEVVHICGVNNVVIKTDNPLVRSVC